MCLLSIFACSVSAARIDAPTVTKKERTNERKNCVVLRCFVCCRCHRFPFVGGKLSRGFYSCISYRTQIAILFKRARFRKHDGGAICSPVPPLHFFFLSFSHQPFRAFSLWQFCSGLRTSLRERPGSGRLSRWASKFASRATSRMLKLLR